MKTINTNLKYILVLLVTLAFGAEVNAQSNVVAKRYRVTAYKNGDTKIISQSNIATVVPAPTLFVPNAFTPNTDGINEKFGVVGQGIGYFNMKIYNAWGEMVYECNSPEDGWDGKFRGVDSPVGTYIYTITARGLKGDHIYRNGNFSLVK